MSEYTISAQVRTDAGKGASRRLRREQGLVPGIVYGGKKEPQNISMAHKDLLWFLDDEAFFTSVLTIDIDGSQESVVLKDLQRHPAKAQVLHADFLRVNADTKLTLHVPLHFLNEESCVGVKMQGGNITHAMTDVEISCLPKDLPEFIEVDLQECETGTTIHLSDLKLPAGVEIPALGLGDDHDSAVATVHAKRGGDDAEEGEEGGEQAPASEE